MKNRITKALRATGGFTLVELVVVLVIMGILATMTVPALTGYIDDGKRKQAVTEAQNCVLTGNALAAVQRKADTTEDKSGFKTWAGGGFHDEGSPATDATLMLSEGSGAYYAGDAAGPGTSAGTAADAITTQAKVPGVINTIWFSAGGQVVYLQYTSGNVLVTYTGNGADTVTVSTVATPNVPTPVLITPSPIPTDEPLPTPTATAEPKKATITVYAVDKAGNKLAGVPLKITGEDLGLSDSEKEWTSGAAGKAFTLEYPSQHNFTVRINENDTNSTYYQNFNTVKLELKLDANGKATVTGYGTNGSVSADGKEVYLTCLAKPKIFVGYKNAKNQYEKLAGIPVGFTKSGTGSADKTWTSDTTGYAIGNLGNNVTYTVAVNDSTSLDAYFDTSDAKFTFSVNADGKLTPPSATAYFYEDTATGDYYLVLPARPSNFHLQYTNGKDFPDNKVAFVSGAATALQGSKPDTLQFTAPATLEKLFETVTVYSEINWSWHTLNYNPALTGLDDFTVTGNYNPNTAGTYTLTIETKYSGSTTLTVTVYDYETYSVPAYGGGAAVLKFGLPWEFYKTRWDDAHYGSLQSGNLVLDGTARPYLAGAPVATSYDTAAAAQTGASYFFGKLSESKIITDCEECYKDGKWQMDVPPYSLGYFNGKLYYTVNGYDKSINLKIPNGDSEWNWALLPEWCYEFVMDPTTLSVTDSLSLDYLKATYTDFQTSEAQVYSYDTLTGVKFKLFHADGTEVSTIDSDGNPVSGEFSIHTDAPKKLLLPAGDYRLEETGMAADKDKDWYACSDNENNDGTTYSAKNMTIGSGNPYLTFHVVGGGDIINLVYHPYLTIEVKNENNAADTSTPGLRFTRYKYSASAMMTADVFTDGAKELQTFTQPVPFGSTVKLELLPRSDHGSSSINELHKDGASNGFSRGKLYLTPTTASTSSIKPDRVQFNYAIWLSDYANGHFFNDSFMLRVLGQNKTFTAQSLSFAKAPTVQGNVPGLIEISGSTVTLTLSDKNIQQDHLKDSLTHLLEAAQTVSNNGTQLDSYAAPGVGSTINKMYVKTTAEDQLVLRTLTWCLWRPSATSTDWYLLATAGSAGSTDKPLYAFKLNSSGTLQYKSVGTASVTGSNGIILKLSSTCTNAVKNTAGWTDCPDGIQIR